MLDKRSTELHKLFLNTFIVRNVGMVIEVETQETCYTVVSVE